MRLQTDFDSGVKVDEIPTEDFLEIISQLDAIAEAMIELPTGSALWQSLLAGPLAVSVSGWDVRYVVDMAGDRLLVMSVSRA